MPPASPSLLAKLISQGVMYHLNFETLGQPLCKDEPSGMNPGSGALLAQWICLLFSLSPRVKSAYCSRTLEKDAGTSSPMMFLQWHWVSAHSCRTEVACPSRRRLTVPFRSLHAVPANGTLDAATKVQDEGVAGCDIAWQSMRSKRPATSGI